MQQKQKITKRTGYGDNIMLLAAIVYGHGSSFAGIFMVAIALVDQLSDCHATVQDHAHFPVLGKHQVLGLQCGGAAYLHAFLAVVGHVEGNSTLPVK